MSLSTQMERLMKEKKVSRYKLSKATGIPYTTLTQIINGRTKDPQINALGVLAEYFNVSVDYIIGESASFIIEDKLEEKGITLSELAGVLIVEENINVAIKLLRENGYSVIKLSKSQIKDRKECGELEGDKECFGCSCSDCVVR